MAPTFGTERRGAPVFTSLKLAKEKIYDISPIETPDIVVVLDHLLLTEADVTSGLKPGGLIVLNTPKPFGSLRLRRHAAGRGRRHRPVGGGGAAAGQGELRHHRVALPGVRRRAVRDWCSRRSRRSSRPRSRRPTPRRPGSPTSKRPTVDQVRRAADGHPGISLQDLTQPVRPRRRRQDRLLARPAPGHQHRDLHSGQARHRGLLHLLALLPRLRDLAHHPAGDRLRILQGLRHLRRGVPHQGHHHGRRGRLARGRQRARSLLHRRTAGHAHNRERQRRRGPGGQAGRGPGDRRLSHHAADPAHREALGVHRVRRDEGPVRPGRERALRPRRLHRRQLHRRAGLHRHQRQRAALHARAGPLGRRRAAAHRHVRGEPGRRRSLEHLERPPGLHLAARHRLDPDVRLRPPADHRRRAQGLLPSPRRSASR